LADPSGSAELAARVSRYRLADTRSPQAPCIIPNPLAQADPLILRFERWTRDHLNEGFSLQDDARALRRRCQAGLGNGDRASLRQRLGRGVRDLRADLR